MDEQARCGGVGRPDLLYRRRRQQKQERWESDGPVWEPYKESRVQYVPVVRALGDCGCSWDGGDEDGWLGIC
jgi:hypothetical protein